MTRPYSIAFKQKMIERLTGRDAVTKSRSYDSYRLSVKIDTAAPPDNVAVIPAFSSALDTIAASSIKVVFLVINNERPKCPVLLTPHPGLNDKIVDMNHYWGTLPQ